jgi:glycosyltransferase involved in cell wall biosynthesis
MKILYDHQVFWAQKTGGISRYFNELLEGNNADKSIRDRVFLGLYANEYLSDATIERTSVGIGIKCRQFRGMRHVNRALWESWVRFQSADIYHPTYYETMSAPRGAKKVLTVYDFIHERFSSGNKAFIEQKHRAIKEADLLLCISEATRQDLLKYCNVDPAKTRVTHLGCSDVFTPNYGPRERFLLYVGSRSGYKNYDLLKRVYESNPDIYQNYKLVCFGGPVPLPSDIPLNGRFEYKVGGDDILADYYRRARLFVYPSLYEGFGLPLIEALRSGCPVLTTEGGSITEVAGSHVNYFGGGDIDELSSRLKMVLGCTIDFFNQERGFIYASSYSWGKCCSKTVEFYQQVI